MLVFMRFWVSIIAVFMRSVCCLFILIPFVLADDKYDFIVVGGGSAGCVFVNHIIEHSNYRVLLLEAGDESPGCCSDMFVPALAVLHQGGKYDWSITTEPQEDACKAMHGQKVRFPLGKGLGGSSLINQMIYLRGDRSDFERWCASGCSNWSYDKVLPVFEDLENYQGAEKLGGGTYGQKGVLPVSTLVFQFPATQAFIEAANQAGYEKVNDFNSGEVRNKTVGRFQTTTLNGLRVDAASAFLPFRVRNNNRLTVETGATASNVLCKKSDNIQQAYGITYYSKWSPNVVHVAQCTKEVIVAAGAVHSPQLLMLSGIGSEKILQEHNIKVRKHLPVGENLQDHIMVPIPYSVVQESLDPDTQTNCWKQSKAICRYLLPSMLFSNFGVLSSNIAEAGAFFSTQKNSQPDIQIFFGATAGTDDYWNALNIDTNKAQFLGLPFQNNGVCLLPTLLSPKSRGTVTLISSNPFFAPVVNPRYLSDKERKDIEVLAEGMREVFRIMERQKGAVCHVESVLKDSNNEPLLVVDPSHLPSDEALGDYIRHLATSAWDLCGTCKMGRIDDPSAVVDEHLKVMGVDGLRVIDASVFPVIPSCNINATVMMVAKRAAMFVLKDYPEKVKIE